MTTLHNAAELLYAKTDARVHAGTITYRHGENIRRGVAAWLDVTLRGKRLGETRCAKVSVLDVEDHLLQQITGAPKTIRAKLDALKLLFDVACRQGWVDYNPARQVKLEVARYKRGGKNKAVQRFDIAEIRRLIEVALAADKDWCDGLAVAYAAQTGLRFGEQAAVYWSDMCFQTERVSVERALRQTSHSVVGCDVPKTDAAIRTVFLTPQLVKELKAWRLRSPASSDDDLVFITRSGTMQRTSDNWRNRVLHPACDAAGIDRMKWHMLRHFFASVCLEMFGTDLNRITTLMGHTSIATTKELYGHWIDDPERDEIDAARFGAKVWGEK